jgi:hypothetical protein
MGDRINSCEEIGLCLAGDDALLRVFWDAGGLTHPKRTLKNAQKFNSLV